MKKPNYIEELYAMVFFWLGNSFLVVGLFAYIGFLKPTPQSDVQDPIAMGISFFVLGVVFYLTQIVLKVIASAHEKLHNELLANGTKVNGTVEKVYLQKYTNYGKASPYRIYYHFTDQGNILNRKSRLLWAKPEVVKGDSIVVYVNEFGKSTIQ